MNHIVHTYDTVDIARVVAEEDTSKGCEGAHQVRLDRDGGLDALDVGGRDEIRASPSRLGRLGRLDRLFFRHDGQRSLTRIDGADEVN